MAQLRSVPQTAMDEQVIEDSDVEEALEERERRKETLGATRKEYDEANEAAKAQITKLELPDGGIARVGRFRVTREAIPGRSVSFETKPSSRIRIAVAGED